MEPLSGEKKSWALVASQVLCKITYIYGEPHLLLMVMTNTYKICVISVRYAFSLFNLFIFLHYIRGFLHVTTAVSTYIFGPIALILYTNDT
jgi:hypothetical protein